MTTFVLYTVASEKMPWLLVNVTLPLIVLSGKFLSEVVGTVQWRRVLSAGGLTLVPGVPLFVVLLYGVAFFSVDGWRDTALLATMSLGLVALAVGGFFLARRTGYRNFAALSTLSLLGLLAVLSLRAGWVAAYRNADVPVEMIVYTQTTPDLARLVRYVEGKGLAAGGLGGVPVTVDGTHGFHWPWRWYLRDSNRAGWVSYDGSPPALAPSASVLLVHSLNQPELDPVLLERYVEGKRIKHRWWFPENYRGLTLGKFLGAVADRDAWRNAMDYFLHRKLSAPLGSEDAYLYFSRDFCGGFRAVAVTHLAPVPSTM